MVKSEFHCKRGRQRDVQEKCKNEPDQRYDLWLQEKTTSSRKEIAIKPSNDNQINYKDPVEIS